jgi:hypothetical protein
MTSNYPETDNFGLVRVGEGESNAKDGFAVTDKNVVSLDRILKALADHDHTGGTRLADPAVAPDVTLNATGGILPAGQTYYYLISYEDQYGLETAASPEASVTTAPPLGVPTSPALTAEDTGGTLIAGIYRYVLASRTAGGGLTTTSSIASVQPIEGTTNRILIALPEMPAGAEALVIFRARPGQSQYYYWQESTSGDDLYDDGSVAEDATVLAPAYNTTSGTNSVTVSVPGGTLPDGVAKWRIYRTSQPGFYNGLNLVHLVSEGLTESATLPRPDWVDDGSGLLRGQPRRTSATLTPPPELSEDADLAELRRGARAWSVFVPGTVAPGTVYGKTTRRTAFRIDQMTAHFQSAPTTSPTGAQVGFELIPDYDTAAAELSPSPPYHRPAVGTDGTGAFAAARFPSITGGQLATLSEPGISVDKDFQAENGNLMSSAVVNDATNYSGDKAVELNAAGDWVDVNLGELEAGDYTATAYVYTPNVSETDGLKVTVYRASIYAPGTPADIVVQQTFTARLAPPAGPAGRYVLPFRVTAADVSGGDNQLFVRVEKLAAATTAVYHVDYVRLSTANRVLDAGPVALRATLVDDPDAAVLPPYSTGPDRVAITGFARSDDSVIRAYVREGIETSVDIPIASSDTTSMSWSAASDQTWCTLSAAGGTGTTATVTATVDLPSLAAGSRTLATVTFTASGYEPLAIQVVALRTPTALGGNVNVTIND